MIYMEIEKRKYQYVKPERYEVKKTRGTTYTLESEWLDYYAVQFIKNYWTGDKLEFWKALREDLENELAFVKAEEEKELSKKTR